MWNFLGFLRKSDNHTDKSTAVEAAGHLNPKSSFTETNFAPSMLAAPRSGEGHADSSVATYKELINTMFRDTARMSGIPKEWLICEVLILAETSQTKFHIQFVVRHWNTEFVNHMPAFQKSFTDRVQRFSPTLINRIHSVSWRFSSRCECPVTTLPPADYWSETACKARIDRQKREAMDQLFSQTHPSIQQMELHGKFQDTNPSTIAMELHGRFQDSSPATVAMSLHGGFQDTRPMTSK